MVILVIQFGQPHGDQWLWYQHAPRAAHCFRSVSKPCLSCGKSPASGGGFGGDGTSFKPWQNHVLLFFLSG